MIVTDKSNFDVFLFDYSLLERIITIILVCLVVLLIFVSR